MNASDISRSAARAGIDEAALCVALRDMVLPLLRDLRSGTSRWAFWLRLAFGVVVSALEAYVASRCGARA